MKAGQREASRRIARPGPGPADKREGREVMAHQGTGGTTPGATDGIEVNRSPVCGQACRLPARPTCRRHGGRGPAGSRRRAGAGAVALLLCLAISHAAAAQVRRLEINGGFAFAPLRRDEAAAYFTVVNHGTMPDTLLSAHSPWAKEVVLHKTTGGARLSLPGRAPSSRTPTGGPTCGDACDRARSTTWSSAEGRTRQTSR